MGSELTISFPIKTIATLGFYITAMIYVIFSVVLYYHWRAYSIEAKTTRLTFIIFFGLSLPLLATLGIMTINLN